MGTGPAPMKNGQVADGNLGLFGAFIFWMKKGEDLKASDMWDFRRRHNLTGSDLAKIVGVHKSQISRWETYQRRIPLWLEKFLACLDATLPGKAVLGTNSRRAE